MKLYDTRKGILYDPVWWSNVMGKPNLNLYMGRTVKAITHGEQAWEWGIKLEGDIEIRNRNRNDTFMPIGLVGFKFSHLSLSAYDTTLHFRRKGEKDEKVSFKPTQYALVDPHYSDGEVYPQWPEELEAIGITSHPDEPASSPASEGWASEESRLVNEQEERRAGAARGFLKFLKGDKED